MDKRKQFQLQLLSNKLAEYTTKLESLKLKQTELSNTISLGNADTTEALELEQKKQQQKVLEANILGYKNDITKYRSVSADLQNQIKLLPGLLETNKKKEQDIYYEEIQNIEGRTQEAAQVHLDTLASLEIEKSQLSLEIKYLQDAILQARENISSIQESSHANRKNTLLELKQKKQEKVAVATALEEFNKTKELYTSNYIEISTLLDNLVELKTGMINTYYTNPNNILNTPHARDLLPAALVDMQKDGLRIDELFNNIISYIDGKIQESRYLLSNISKKSARVDKNITLASSNLKTKLELATYGTSRGKVISYKDNYKNAKMEKTILEDKLSKLQTRLDSWELEVIDRAKQEYKIMLESLEADKQRAKERLDIMTSRITNEHSETIISLGNKIKQVENDLTNTHTLLKKTNQELSILLEEIAKNNSTKIELDNINAQIANAELAIQKIQQDINSLSS